MTSLVGTIVEERYDIIAQVGAGGSSDIYKATDKQTGSVVALKMLHKHLVTRPEKLKRFQQEATAASVLSHPNIISIHGCGITADQQPYLVMDLIEGRTLSDLIAEPVKMAPERMVTIFLQICSAMAHAHERGVIHRNLKPNNIIVVESGRIQDQIKIVDLGLAKLLPESGKELDTLTKAGAIMGSPLYMSPEQCTGKKCDQRADIYSVGCMMYEALEGSPPFSGENFIQLMTKHVSQAPARITGIAGSAEVREHLETVVFKAMAKDPDKRYQSMKALQGDLDATYSPQSNKLQMSNSVCSHTATLPGVGPKQGPPFKKLVPWVAGALAITMVLLVLSVSNKDRDAEPLPADSNDRQVLKQAHELRNTEPEQAAQILLDGINSNGGAATALSTVSRARLMLECIIMLDQVKRHADWQRLLLEADSGGQSVPAGLPEQERGLLLRYLSDAHYDNGNSKRGQEILEQLTHDGSRSTAATAYLRLSERLSHEHKTAEAMSAIDKALELTGVVSKESREAHNYTFMLAHKASMSLQANQPEVCLATIKQIKELQPQEGGPSRLPPWLAQELTIAGLNANLMLHRQDEALASARILIAMPLTDNKNLRQAAANALQALSALYRESKNQAVVNELAQGMKKLGL